MCSTIKDEDAVSVIVLGSCQLSGCRFSFCCDSKKHMQKELTYRIYLLELDDSSAGGSREKPAFDLMFTRKTNGSFGTNS
ncbi:hypothetical protein QQF64_002629 [Cirrhinus molitorella]|uniref:Uncharacterized protein n=1 Tax=Cirrhinus molitorella TaxID=172907 RepID=A0ABR3MQP8_9TELE